MISVSQLHDFRRLPSPNGRSGRALKIQLASVSLRPCFNDRPSKLLDLYSIKKKEEELQLLEAWNQPNGIRGYYETRPTILKKSRRQISNELRNMSYLLPWVACWSPDRLRSDKPRTDSIGTDRFCTDRLTVLIANIGLQANVWDAKITCIRAEALIKAIKSKFILKFVQKHVNLSTFLCLSALNVLAYQGFSIPPIMFWLSSLE